MFYCLGFLVRESKEILFRALESERKMCYSGDMFDSWIFLVQLKWKERNATSRLVSSFISRLLGSHSADTLKWSVCPNFLISVRTSYQNLLSQYDPAILYLTPYDLISWRLLLLDSNLAHGPLVLGNVRQH